MFFLVFGSSGAGKTFALAALRKRLPDVAIHDFDEIGVPPGADTAWRQRSNELWIRRALEYQAGGIDMLLAGQTPLGELLATPSAPLLDAISACLLDCDEKTRVARLEARGPDWSARSAGTLDDYLKWAEWMRRHAADPGWRTDVIAGESGEEMRWQRWRDWRAGDRRWRVRVIDTTGVGLEEIVGALSAWIEDERARFRAGQHALAEWAERNRGRTR